MIVTQVFGALCFLLLFLPLATASPDELSALCNTILGSIMDDSMLLREVHVGLIASTIPLAFDTFLDMIKRGGMSRKARDRSLWGRKLLISKCIFVASNVIPSSVFLSVSMSCSSAFSLPLVYAAMNKAVTIIVLLVWFTIMSSMNIVPDSILVSVVVPYCVGCVLTLHNIMFPGDAYFSTAALVMNALGYAAFVASIVIWVRNLARRYAGAKAAKTPFEIGANESICLIYRYRSYFHRIAEFI
jgi:hypothetical protein